MKYIELVLKLQWDYHKVLCIIFKKIVTVHEDIQWAISLAVNPQIRPRNKHIVIKYHHFRIFFAKGDIEIKNVDTKEQISDIFMNPLDPELFVYLHCSINGW